VEILKLIDTVDGVDFTGVQPYVFTPSGDEIDELPDQPSEILASPFPKFSIEIDGGFPLTSDNETDAATTVLYCEELAPDDYIFIMNLEISGEKGYVIVTKYYIHISACGKTLPTKPDECHTAYNQYKNLVHSMLNRLHDRKNRIGLVNEPGRAKYKDLHGKKQFYKPKGVIYCGTRNEAKGNAASGSPITWKHSWSVAAHWRRLTNPESLGMDRYGERTVKGYTWVGHYIKGDGDVVGKIRKVS